MLMSLLSGLFVEAVGQLVILVYGPNIGSVCSLLRLWVS